jgi:hypothetical protein
MTYDRAVGSFNIFIASSKTDSVIVIELESLGVAGVGVSPELNYEISLILDFSSSSL